MMKIIRHATISRTYKINPVPAFGYSNIMKVTSALVLALASCLVHGKVTINKFEHCDPNADYPIKTVFQLKEKDGVQIIDEGSVTSSVDMGNNILEVIDVCSVEANGECEHLITIKENLCDAVNKYMGEFMHDMQVKAGLEPGACPVPAGTYKINDHALDFEKFKFKKIPEGEFRCTVTLVDSATNNTLNCHIVQFKLEK